MAKWKFPGFEPNNITSIDEYNTKIEDQARAKQKGIDFVDSIIGKYKDVVPNVPQEPTLNKNFTPDQAEQQRLADIQLRAIKPLSKEDSTGANRVNVYNENMKLYESMLPKAIEEVKQNGTLTEKASVINSLITSKSDSINDITKSNKLAGLFDNLGGLGSGVQPQKPITPTDKLLEGKTLLNNVDNTVMASNNFASIPNNGQNNYLGNRGQESSGLVNKATGKVDLEATNQYNEQLRGERPKDFKQLKDFQKELDAAEIINKKYSSTGAV